METRTIIGLVETLKLIKAQDPALVHLKVLTSNQETIHALVAKQAYDFILKVQVGDELSLFGHYNQRKQFIIDKYLIRHQAPQVNSLPPHLSYPSKRPE
ncbi:hypothetical protein [Vaginisenegalia massiliensis]|uniref:hypothetical protein n=1 Tax=Vaginisenegalia massiliensis TaxID=2058294 RepID=UPI000F53CFBA|nr:hypothetical protein [Vaginisenegalia massiliensis]